MKKNNQNFSFFRGESRTIFIALKNADGTNMDLTGMTMRWVLSKSPYSTQDDEGDWVIEKSLSNGLALATGGVNLTLLNGDTDIPPNYYYHELKLFLPGGGQDMGCSGIVNIRPALRLLNNVQMAARPAILAGVGTVT